MNRPRRWLLTLLDVSLVLAVLVVYAVISPPALLTAYPPVYHDDYTLAAAAAGLLRGDGLSLPPYNSTPELEQAFGGRGSLTPGLNAGYSVALAGWIGLTDLGIAEVRLFGWCMGAVVLIATYCLGTQWWNRWVGLTATLLLLFDASSWYTMRAVRPEPWTVSMYLLAACLLSIRDEKWRGRIPEVAGLLLGIGLCGHPVSAVIAPVVVLIPCFTWGRIPPPRFLFRFLAPCALVAAAYAGFLAAHWPDVKANMEVHAQHRSLHSRSLAEKAAFEWQRYHTGYLNQYQVTLGNRLRGAAFCAAALLAAMVALGRRGTPRRGAGALFAGSVFVLLAGMAVLARDDNFPYLLNILPWLYLAATGCGCYLAGLCVPPRLRRRSVAALSVAVFAVPGLLAVAGLIHYRASVSPYQEQPVIGYDEVERLITEQLPPGSFVLGMETAWLAAERADARFVYNRVLHQWLPPYRRYPVRAAHDGSHVTDYVLDLDLIAELDRAGKPVHYVADMWDWGWNAYYPHGQYAKSYLQLRRQLDESFVPVLHVFTRDRGLISLYRYAGPEAASISETSGTPPVKVYVESQPHTLGREVPIASRAQQDGRFELPAEALQAVPVAEFDVEPGCYYLLRVEIATDDGATAIVCWDGLDVPKYVDAAAAIPFETVVHASTSRGTLSARSFQPGASVRIENVRLWELRPTE